MKTRISLLILLTIYGLSNLGTAQDFPNGEVAALVNGETISQKFLLKVLEESYGESMARSLLPTTSPGKDDVKIQPLSGKEVAENLDPKVIQAVLEEWIIFKVIDQSVKNITTTPKEYADTAPYYEEPFFLYFKEWGLQNTITFTKTLQTVAKTSQEFLKKHGSALEQLSTQYEPKPAGYQMLENVWQDMLADTKLKEALRQEVFSKYYVNAKIFDRKVKISAKFQKYVLSQITDKEAEEFASQEKFALEGGMVRFNHIMFLTVDRIKNENMTEPEEKKVLERVQSVKKQIKPDMSNFQEMAMLVSEDVVTKTRGGQVGWVPRWTTFTIYGGFLLHLGWIPHWTAFMEEVVAEAYRLPEKKIGEPVKSRMGYHLVMVAKRKDGGILSKEQLLKKAKEQLAFLKMEKLLRTWLQKSKIERKL